MIGSLGRRIPYSISKCGVLEFRPLEDELALLRRLGLPATGAWSPLETEGSPPGPREDGRAARDGPPGGRR